MAWCIAILRTFVQLRRLMNSNALLADKIQALEERYANKNQQFQLVFEASKQLIATPAPPRPRNALPRPLIPLHFSIPVCSFSAFISGCSVFAYCGKPPERAGDWTGGGKKGLSSQIKMRWPCAQVQQGSVELPQYPFVFPLLFPKPTQNGAFSPQKN